MRLERLALEKYGRFTGREIAFAPDARLHVVFGPNEAGKTTALQAVGDLLYGIEERTRFNFLHPNDDLRIGAELMARDGRRIAFRRRKGRGNTLLDADDRPLPDATLDPWLAGVSREVFRHSFGLSQDGLRQGGEAMLAADGEVGRSLFAAASGLTGLAELSRALRQESDALFKKSSRGATKFDQLNQTYDKARRTARERSLAYESWRELTERITGLESRADDIRKRRASVAVERAMLERLRRVAPLLARIDRAEQQLVALADLPELPPGFDRRIFTCLQTLEKVERDAREQAGMLAEVEARLARIRREPALLAQGERIDGLVERLQTLREAARDLPGQETEGSEAEALLENYARRLGLADAGELARSEPSDAVRERARKLITDGAALQATASDLRRQREDLQAEISAAQAKCALLADARDPEQLRRRLGALRPELAAVAGHPELAADIERRNATLDERAARIDPAIPLDTLAHSRLPSAETVREFATEATALARQATELAARRHALTEAIVKEQQVQTAIAGGADLPTPEAIAAARRTRDRLWDAARDLVRSDTAPRTLDAAARTRLAGNLDLAIREADILADRRDAEGDRLARHHEITRRVHEAQEALDRLAQQDRDLARRRQTHEESWLATWADLHIAPRAPNEMLRWLDAAARLIGEREAIMADMTKLGALAARAAALVPVLAALAADLGVRPDPLPLAVWARDLELATEAAAGRWQSARDAARDLEKARLALARMAEAEQHHEAALNAWRSAWREAMPAIGLRAEASDEEARAALAAWSQIPQARTRRDISRRRVQAMKQALAENFGAAAEIAAQVAPDIAAADPIPAIEALRDRLARARALDTEAAQVAAEQTRARDRHAEVQRRLADAMAERDAIVRGSGIVDPAGLETLATRIRERGMTHAALAILRSDLTEQGEGCSEGQLRADREALSGDAATERAAAVEDEDRRLVDELAGAQATIRSALQEREVFESGRCAEVAAQEQAAAEAGLADLARNYALLQAACLLVTAAIERHRERYQDPLIARASALFRQVTGAGFSGLALDYRDGDTLSLVAERPDGRRVSIAGLSEGSRDQLYLALRLAALAELAARSDPLPFVCDDLLVSFDDARAALALEALAAAGETIQVILFTHHHHIVTLARSKLRNAVDLIEL